MAQRTPIVLFLTLIFLFLTLQPVNALTMQDFANTPAQKQQREQNRKELLNLGQQYYKNMLLQAQYFASSLPLKIPNSPIRQLANPNFSIVFSQIPNSLDPIISRLSTINNLLSQIKSTLQSLVTLKEKIPVL